VTGGVPNFDKLLQLGLATPAEASSRLSLEEARAFLNDRLDDGVFCPCCRQYAKRYVRKLNSGMAKVLIRLCGLARSEDSPWVSIKKLEAVSREVHKLAWWNLVVSDENRDPKKKASGYWCPTPRAYDFVWGKASLPERAIVYGNKLEGFEGDLIAIWQALGSDFDYQELMATTPGLAPEWNRATA
jgi:hypothetical protein